MTGGSRQAWCRGTTPSHHREGMGIEGLEKIDLGVCGGVCVQGGEGGGV